MTSCSSATLFAENSSHDCGFLHDTIGSLFVVHFQEHGFLSRSHSHVSFSIHFSEIAQPLFLCDLVVTVGIKLIPRFVEMGFGSFALL
jgi:hypothetical protein